MLLRAARFAFSPFRSSRVLSVLSFRTTLCDRCTVCLGESPTTRHTQAQMEAHTPPGERIETMEGSGGERRE
uniref:Putative secreted protein n=1 Tax=Anopheles triannulatus TaxID=58253 RepID=A0A2M4B7I0_9DIPT